MKNEMPEELKAIFKAFIKDIATKDKKVSVDNEQEKQCADCDCCEEEFHSKGANNPIYYCDTTDSIVDIVTMHQNVTTFEVNFEFGDDDVDDGRRYTYKTDHPVSVDDIVVVETPSGICTALVTAVHTTTNFIVDNAYSIRWAISILPTKAYEAKIAADKRLGETLAVRIDKAIAAKVAKSEEDTLTATRKDLTELLGDSE